METRPQETEPWYHASLPPPQPPLPPLPPLPPSPPPPPGGFQHHFPQNPNQQLNSYPQPPPRSPATHDYTAYHRQEHPPPGPPLHPGLVPTPYRYSIPPPFPGGYPPHPHPHSQGVQSHPLQGQNYPNPPPPNQVSSTLVISDR